MPPAHNDNNESARTSQESGSKELFGKDRLRPLRSAAPSDHQRLVKKPAKVTPDEADKTTRSLPKTKANNS